jgi:DNA-binding response OmpR family regulator
LEGISLKENLKKEKILLVEDDPDHAELIMEVLETENVQKEIILLKDGLEALNYFQKYEENGAQIRVSLIILDLNLPKIHGMKVLKILKQNSRFSSIPVAILSTSSDDETIEEVYKNGADNYISKPTLYEDFVEKVKALSLYC